MRFDDSLNTVLAADVTSEFGARSAFRQLVDLIARRRSDAEPALLDRLRDLRERIPATTRQAVARALALTTPPAALVAFFAEDEPSVVAPVLRSAVLRDDEWLSILERLGPVGRSILRERTNLSEAVRRALASFGTTDFTLGDETRWGLVPAERSEPVADAFPAPADAEPARSNGQRGSDSDADGGGDRSDIAKLVDRIGKFQRDRAVAPPRPAAPPATLFEFDTDEQGRIRWADGVSLAPLIGRSLTESRSGACVDGTASGAFRKRAAFRDARLVVPGESDAGGEWRISAAPMFLTATGRFVGMRGVARRPRAEERAEPAPGLGRREAESLRRLVHELRTPLNAISGFAELIDGQLLGKVPATYRKAAAAIRDDAADLLTAIDDLDLAARIESDALDLRAGVVPLQSVIRDAINDLAPLAELRGCSVTLRAASEVTARLDDRAAARLVSRLLATVISAAAPDEVIGLDLSHDSAGMVRLDLSRPARLSSVSDEALLSIDSDQAVIEPGEPLLGTGFALRLVRSLARKLGGSLSTGERSLTLRLPSALNEEVGQTSSR